MAHDQPHAHPAHVHGHDHHVHDDGHGHAHAHSHGHAHGHHHHGAHDAGSAARIGLAALLTGAFMGVELVGGVISGSLALIADAGHMMSDFASLALAWIGFRMAQRPADARRTFGLRRFPVLAAFVNGLSLFAIAVWIIAEAIGRLANPASIEPVLMTTIAAGGLLVNIAAVIILHGADRDNLNVRGAFLHVIGDLLGSLAAIGAGVIIMTTGRLEADPILSMLVALIILRSAWTLTAQSAHILLEGAPEDVSLEAVRADLLAHVEGVSDIHHAHLWSLDGRTGLITLHARIPAGADGPATVARLKARLSGVHHIDHATIEIEFGECPERGCC